MKRAAIVLTSACLMLAGCGGSGGTDEAASPSTSSSTSSSSSSAAPSTTAATPTPSTTAPVAPATAAAGTEVATPFGSVTYFGQQRPAAPNAPEPQQTGTEWVAIDVQLCLKAGFQGGTVRSSSWTVRDAGNGLTDPSSIGYAQFPAPEYPTQADLDSGCVRGWITYPIVIGKPLTTVSYQSESNPTSITWTA